MVGRGWGGGGHRLHPALGVWVPAARGRQQAHGGIDDLCLVNLTD